MSTATTSNYNLNNTTTQTIWTYLYPSVVICPNKGKCSSEGYKCGSCKLNEYKDYYVPKDDYYTPWWNGTTITCGSPKISTT